ncbi:MAG: hypothetical protein IIA03_13195 [Proteobacteria bacterium]|nr:hypothetical protein [Pseudomonadota bacterium]
MSPALLLTGVLAYFVLLLVLARRVSRGSGAEGFYVGQALCYHKVENERFSLSFLYRHGIEKGRTEVLMSRAKTGSLVEELKFWLAGVFQLCKGRQDLFRQCVINCGIQRGLRIALRETKVD